MKNNTRLILIIILLISINIFWILDNQEKNRKTVNIPIKENPKTEEAKNENKTIDMCYFYAKQNNSPFEDRAWLKMKITGENVTGSYYNLPAEKDSKVGDFTGKVGKFDPKISGRMADVIWDSLAEGFNVKEELLIEFGEGTAVALFGEMVDRGDGVYVYKDRNTVTPGFLLSQIDCESLDERLIVEKYIRENIAKIATNEEVLGGTWYVISLTLNTNDNKAEVLYEDGHIQSKANLEYEYKNGVVNVKNFQVIN